MSKNYLKSVGTAISAAETAANKTVPVKENAMPKNLKMKIISAWLVFIVSMAAFAQGNPEMRLADKIRVREALRIASRFGDRIWKGYRSAPFAIVLVTDNFEFLINHPDPSSEFKLLNKDEILQTQVYYRKTQFNTHFLATFPAVNGLSCVVIGTPENTNKNSSEWIITLLHEHFHQYQYTSPNYMENVDKLALANGDQTGMWMLNYPFPYASLPVVKQYDAYSKALLHAVTTMHDKDFKGNLQCYLKERKRFKECLAPADYSYFSFQVWQEGLARYTEYKILEALDAYTPAKDVSALSDFVPFKKIKMEMASNELKNVRDNKLEQRQRICFYALGFAEGLLLDKLNKNWRDKYLRDMFFIERYAREYSIAESLGDAQTGSRRPQTGGGRPEHGDRGNGSR